MCGIALVLRRGKADARDEQQWTDLCKCNSLRGPDAQAELALDLAHGAEGTPSWHVKLSLSVLGLRGPKITQQPFVDDDLGLVFGWNGQVFGQRAFELSNGEDHGRMDELLAQVLRKIFEDGMNDGQAIFEALCNLSREARDDRDAVFVALTYILDRIEGPYAFLLIDTKKERILYGRDCLGRRSLLHPKASLDEQVEEAFVLCSASTGSVSSCFELEEVPCSSLWQVDLSQSAKPEPRPRRRPLWVATPTSSKQLEEHKRKGNAERLLQTLRASVASRLPKVSCPSVQANRTSQQAPAILFSGGLDCTVLAMLVNELVPPEESIDLLNVAFENPRALAAKKAQDKDSAAALDPYLTPDRASGVLAYEELKKLAPQRLWRFVKVDVPAQEYELNKQRIMDLMCPLGTVMDLSIAAALWFAARGKGVAVHSVKYYETPVKVLISGLGADELFGGYARHRGAFERGGWDALTKELQLDLDRLPERNLGRDDRIIASSGRECRFPFLSQMVIDFACGLETSEKAQLALGEGIGDKIILRDVAVMLGLQETATRRKRAIQFGARSAKMNQGEGKVKGQVNILAKSA